MAFRFVHCADIHLDSPLRTLALRDRELADLIGAATREAFSRIVDLCLEERVDALLVAGDLYDGDQTSMKTALFLGSELRRLEGAGIRAFLIRGNHDHLARITKELVLPDTTHVFPGKAEAIVIERRGLSPIAIHGLSFAQAHAPESLLPRFRPRLEGAVNVGLLHTSLGGAPGHDPYAPCSAGDLASTGFRYWALGHIHARSIIKGSSCTIVMPGMPQGRHVGESGPKSATIVTVSDDDEVSCEERVTGVAQFERVAVDVSRAADWRDVVQAVDGALAAAREAAVCRHLVATVSLLGASPLAWRMRRDRDLLETEAKSRAASLGNVLIDKVDVDARPPLAAGPSAGPLDELRRTMAEDATSNVVIDAVLEAMEDIRRHLPPECRAALGEDEDGQRRLARDLIAAGGDEVVARLLPLRDVAP